MKTYLLLLLASAAAAASRPPEGTSVGVLGSSQSARLACRVYEFPLSDGKLGAPREIAQKESDSFPVGSLKSLLVELPKPYDGVKVAANHWALRYAESPAATPYLQAFFTADGTQTKDTQFELSTLTAGDQISLRDFYRVSDTAALSFRCGLEAL